MSAAAAYIDLIGILIPRVRLCIETERVYIDLDRTDTLGFTPCCTFGTRLTVFLLLSIWWLRGLALFASLMCVILHEIVKYW